MWFTRMDKHQDDATIVILGMEHQRELYHLGLVNASHPQISKSAVAFLGSFWDGFLDPEKTCTFFSGATLTWIQIYGNSSDKCSENKKLL